MTQLTEFINQRPRAAVLIVLALAVPAFVLSLFRSSAESDFNPAGGIFAVDAELDEQFVPDTPVDDARYIIESSDGDVLAGSAIRELWLNGETLRADPSLQGRLRDGVLPGLGVDVDGVWSIADEVHSLLPSGVVAADDAAIEAALSDLLDAKPQLLATLAVSATEDAGRWSAPALLSFVLFDSTGMEDPDNATGDPDKEEYLRDVQAVLDGESDTISALGLAIDPALTQFDGAASAIPFLLLITKHTKRMPKVLAGICVWILAMHLLDLQVDPPAVGTPCPELEDAAAIFRAAGVRRPLMILPDFFGSHLAAVEARQERCRRSRDR